MRCVFAGIAHTPAHPMMPLSASVSLVSFRTPLSFVLIFANIKFPSALPFLTPHLSSPLPSLWLCRSPPPRPPDVAAQTAAAVRVGNLLGSNQPHHARRAATIALCMVACTCEYQRHRERQRGRERERADAPLPSICLFRLLFIQDDPFPVLPPPSSSSLLVPTCCLLPFLLLHLVPLPPNTSFRAQPR